MGNSLKDELARMEIISKTHNIIMDALIPEVSDPYENMTPEEKKTHERAMMLAQLDSTFEELGINKKLEELKPTLDLCKEAIRHADMTFAGSTSVDALALKRVVEFIEFLDEP